MDLWIYHESTHRRIHIQAASVSKVKELLPLIQDKEGIPPDAYTLQFHGRPLKREALLCDYGIGNNSLITLTPVMRGQKCIFVDMDALGLEAQYLLRDQNRQSLIHPQFFSIAIVETSDPATILTRLKPFETIRSQLPRNKNPIDLILKVEMKPNRNYLEKLMTNDQLSVETIDNLKTDIKKLRLRQTIKYEATNDKYGNEKARLEARLLKQITALRWESDYGVANGDGRTVVPDFVEFYPLDTVKYAKVWSILTDVLHGVPPEILHIILDMIESGLRIDVRRYEMFSLPFFVV